MVGVIGCGGIARFHFSGLAKAGAQVRWACDLDEQAARPWAQRFNARVTRDYRDVMADPQVQAVVVATVSSAHKEICLSAIAAGKAVICEKTLAQNAQDAWEIVRAARQAGTILYTSYMKRFIPAVGQAKRLLPSLGKIVSTHIRAHQCWGNLWEATPDSGIFHRPAGGTSQVRGKYGGGILVCGGSHILDLVLHLLGRPVWLAAFMHTPAGLDVDLQAAVLMDTPNGRVLLEALAHPLARIGFLRDGWDERVEITGARGRLEIYSSAWDQVDSKASLLVHYDNASGIATEHRYAPESPFDRAAAFFCENIEQGRQGDQSPLTGYEVDNLIEHVQRSAQLRQAVQVQWQA
jgi:predicted dehydrogenase